MQLTAILHVITIHLNQTDPHIPNPRSILAKTTPIPFNRMTGREGQHEYLLVTRGGPAPPLPAVEGIDAEGTGSLTLTIKPLETWLAWGGY